MEETRRDFHCKFAEYIINQRTKLILFKATGNDEFENALYSISDLTFTKRIPVLYIGQVLSKTVVHTLNTSLCSL